MSLTHSGYHFADIFNCIYLNWYIFDFDLTFTEVCFPRPNSQHASIDSDNGLVPNRQQVIIWNNNGLGYQCIYASLSLNESSSTSWSFVLPNCLSTFQTLLSLMYLKWKLGSTITVGTFLLTTAHQIQSVFNPQTAGNTWVRNQHCDYWCPGAKG